MTTELQVLSIHALKRSYRLRVSNNNNNSSSSSSNSGNNNSESNI